MLVVVIPSYRVKAHVLDVIGRIGPEVGRIYVVDDKCPDGSGEFVRAACSDPRVKVLFNEVNRGVGGATKRGFQEAFQDGCSVAVKLDGDGQMDPALIPRLVRPILEGRADYTKGNRFFHPRALKGMPWVRLVGNAGLSFLTKLTTGYWHVMDPTNGFLAIDMRLLKVLPLDLVDDRYFFETDLLFRLHLVDAVVSDFPMKAQYGDETSHLRVSHSLFSFGAKHMVRLFKRILYDYFVRDFNVASVELMAGSILFLFGLIFGFCKWRHGIETGVPTETGAIMFSVIPLFLGFQLLLSALNFDIGRRSRDPVARDFG